MNVFFEKLFAYSFHYNQQLAAIFMEHGNKIDPKSIGLFSHMLNAHHTWNCRVLRQQTEYNIWEKHPVDLLAAIDRHNYDQTLAILGTVDLTKEIAYTTSKGQPFTNTVSDILFHIVNHSTYHRGQLALLFRQHGMEPLVTDYIFYKR